MPELPEVETTIRSLNRTVKGLRIIDIWSSYNSAFHSGKNNIKDVDYFKKFKKAVTGKKILSAERIAKNIIINLSEDTSILVHMKMTGHFLYGKYDKNYNFQTPRFHSGQVTNSKKIQNPKLKKQNWEWRPANKTNALNDPMNRFIRLVFTLSNGKHLAFSDLRKFAKVNYFPTKEKNILTDLKNIGPEPLDKNFTFEKFKNQLLKKPNGKIKQVLMDPSIIAGIGNIYSDEILWASNIHPFSKPNKVPDKFLKIAFSAMKKILLKAIKTGGDSMSDFRGIDGKPGDYQNFHRAYRQTGKPCSKPKCNGKINRAKMGGRSAHFCSIHQIKY